MGMKRLVRIRFWGFFVVILFVQNGLQAQNTDLNPKVEALMEAAIAHMNSGAYEEANVDFREILKLKTVLPTDLSYLFAETLYMIHQYHNSKNFLDKYLRLAGATGKYYPQAVDLKSYLDDAFEEILSCNHCDNRGYRLVACDTCHETGVLTDECYYCKGVGINMCPVCKGNGVTTSLNAFNEIQYQTCYNCSGKGRVDCKICLGTKVTTETCPECHGTHKKAGTEICDHAEHQDHGELENQQN